MKVSVIVFPEVQSDRPSKVQGDVKKLCPEIPSITKLDGFYTKIWGGNRKFIVLKGKEEVLVAIGPVMGEGNYYYHRDIKNSIAMSDFNHLSISGGGDVTFSSYGRGWSAKFDGQSGDFGVYDPSILDKEVRKVIGQTIGMSVSFEWMS